MQNEAVDSFLSGLDKVEVDPFKQEVLADPFNTKQEEKKEEEQVEEKLPFNKDPKVLRFIEKEISKRLSAQPNAEREFVKETKHESDSLADVLTRIVGNDTPEKISAVKDLREELSSLKEQARQEALQEIEFKQLEEVKAEQEAMNELTSGFEDIEENFNVDLTSDKAKALRSDFVDFIKLIAPKDEDGEVVEYPDLQETFKLFQKTRTQTQAPNRAKELASRSMNRSSDASAVQQNRDQSWKGVEKMLNKLTG